jgi:hypothetical protein
MEAYTTPGPIRIGLKLDFRQTLREARLQRIAENQLVNCSLCRAS